MGPAPDYKKQLTLHTGGGDGDNQDPLCSRWNGYFFPVADLNQGESETPCCQILNLFPKREETQKHYIFASPPPHKQYKAKWTTDWQHMSYQLPQSTSKIQRTAFNPLQTSSVLLSAPVDPHSISKQCNHQINVCWRPRHIWSEKQMLHSPDTKSEKVRGVYRVTLPTWL